MAQVHFFRCPISNYVFLILWHLCLIIPKCSALVLSKKQNFILLHVTIKKNALVSALILSKRTWKVEKIIFSNELHPLEYFTDGKTYICFLYNCDNNQYSCATLVHAQIITNYPLLIVLVNPLSSCSLSFLISLEVLMVLFLFSFFASSLEAYWLLYYQF